MYTRIRYTLSLTTNGQCCIPPQRLSKTQSKQCIYADTEPRVVRKNEYGLDWCMGMSSIATWCALCHKCCFRLVCSMPTTLVCFVFLCFYAVHLTDAVSSVFRVEWFEHNAQSSIETTGVFNYYLFFLVNTPHIF